ncbi:MAG: VWA domain-containing protein [Nanoarchaeota archaeon]|nr:VWA domain-containing protein [Nanoarchaeota archaeon]
MASISFLYPQYLFFLLLIPSYIFIHLATLKTTKSTALKFANFEAISRIKGIDFFSRNIFILILTGAVALLLVLSLSGMRLHTVIEASSYSFVIAIDSSKSMEADDFSPNRMEAAKKTSMEFIDSLPITTRAGIVSFSGNALIETGMTESKGLLKSAIGEIIISDIAGTDIVEAIITSTNILNSEETKAILLLSDGQINVGAIDEAIRYANDNNVIVHTIAIGTAEGGQTSFGISKVDLDSLKGLSYNTGGESFTAQTQKELLESFNSAIKSTERKVAINLSSYLLMGAILLFSFEYWMISSRYRRLI